MVYYHKFYTELSILTFNKMPALILIYCQTQPQFQVKNSLKADLALFSLDPAPGILFEPDMA